MKKGCFSLLHQKAIVNTMLQKKAEQNPDLKWKLNHGMYITGAKTLYDFLKSIEKHRLADCIGKVTRNLLLLAGEEDQYVPVKRMKDIQNGLIHAKSVTSRVFIRQEGGEQHCQIGEVQLAQKEIDKFLLKVCSDVQEK